MPKIIAEILYKYKGLLEAALLPAIVVLVGLSAFGLGRLSVTGQAPQPITQVTAAGGTTPVVPAPAKTVSAGEGTYVASKSGTKYYLPSCSGVSKIKEENKIYFTTVADAEAAGYSAAANCPGL